MDLTLPLDYAAIERILPHRYPFLLVDRITEFEPDKRIVGIKNVTLNERYLAHRPGEPPVLPPTILTEAIAQVGAILILAKPENRAAADLLHGHRARALPAAGASRRRRRDRSGGAAAAQPDGRPARRRARGRQVVVEGTMTFALGPRNEGRPRQPALTRSPHDQQYHPDLHGPRPPRRPFRIRMVEAPSRREPREQNQRADPALFHREERRHAARVALDRTGARERGARVADRRQHVEREERPSRTARARAAGSDARQQPLVGRRAAPRTRRKRSRTPAGAAARVRWVIAKNGMP